MKQIDFISSENVVNIASLEKINLIGEYSYVRNGAVLINLIDKKNHFNSKNNKAVNHSGVFCKNFEAMPKEITTRINN